MHGPKPFLSLATRRAVERTDLPPDLIRFYSESKALELNAEDHYSICLSPLKAVKRVDWEGLGLVGDRPEGWDAFAGFLIGSGCHFERIVSVIDAPCCESGAILALGGELDWGRGGTGPFAFFRSVVLAASFPEWLSHLEEEGWWEYAVGYGIPDLPVDHQRRLRAYYRALNPNIDWPEPA